jgi:hypothetical protein
VATRKAARRSAGQPGQPAAGPPGQASPRGPAGRDDELGQLRRVVDEAIAGRGQLLLLAGEAGIGKTAMLAAADRYASGRGVRVAWGWGWPGDGATGYWPWVQVLRSLGLDAPLSAAPDQASVDAAPASARFRLFDEVTSALLAESRIQPVLVLLDDLQWAGQPSQLLLDFLARRLPAGAAAVVGSYRDVGPSPGPALAALAARSTVLPLSGLAAGPLTELVAGVAGEQRAGQIGAEVHRRTGGNPFFAQQVAWLLKDGRDGVPPGVREALGQRFAALSPGCAAAVRAAAVAGPRFTVSLLSHACGEPPAAIAAALAEAEAARVLRQDGPGRYRFAHDLLREFGYDQLPAAGRARLHQRIGAGLEAGRARGEDVSLAELAGHFVQADPRSALARRYSVAAAREATSRLAYEQAVRHWEAALAAGGQDPAAQASPLIELAEAQRRAGAGQAAGEAYLRAAELARREQDAAGLARAALGLHALGSRTWWPPAQVVALLSEALDALPPGTALAGPGPLRLRVMASLARVLAWHRLDLPRARELAGQAVGGARAHGDPATLIACLLAQHNSIFAPGTGQRRHALAAEAAALAEQAGDQEALLEARLLAATDLLELADPGFRGELAEFLRLAALSGQPRFQYAALVRRAMLALLAGQLAEAEQLIGQAAMLGAECGEPGVQDVRYDQGWDLLAQQGRLAELAGSLPQMFPDPESVQARSTRALILLAAGDKPGAARAAAPVLDPPPYSQLPADNQALLGVAFGTQLVTGLGAVPAARILHAAMQPFAGQAVVSGVAVTFHGAVAHHLGMLAALLGRPEEAEGHLAAAVAAHERLGALPWALRSRLELAKVWLAGPGRRDRALASLAQIAAAAHQAGLAQLARDAEQAGIAAGQAPVSSGAFTRDGAMWTLSYGGQTVRMRAAKGLADLALLLSVPGRQVAAADLIAAAGAGQAGRASLGLGADEIFDATARRQIRTRLASLAEEIAEAASWHDPGRAARARAERDVLLRELTAATRPGGGSRLLGDQAERARKTVTARIRDAISRIERVHPALGAHLRASVTTGNRCGYSPPAPVTWQLSRTKG